VQKPTNRTLLWYPALTQLFSPSQTTRLHVYSRKMCLIQLVQLALWN
jgi:hypothetical protein